MSPKRINLKIVENAPSTQNGEGVNRNKHSQAGASEMDKAIEKWLNFCQADGLSDESVHDYGVFIAKFNWWYKEYVDLPPGEMTTDHAMAFVAYLKSKQTTSRWGEPLKSGKEKLSPASVATYARTARTFFNWLEERGLIDRSPFNRSVKITSKKDPIITRHHKNLQEDQLAQIFGYLTRPERVATYTGARDLAIVSLLLDSGMRRGELLSMRVRDIDWSRRRLSIRGKTGERTCFYTESAEAALFAYHDNFRKKQKGLLTPNSPYWLTEKGTELYPAGLSEAISKMSEALGFAFSPRSSFPSNIGINSSTCPGSTSNA
jgi:integrase